jgi:MoaA/NifB/PqqE/SkfB family radical SAM enzyme
MIESIKGFQIEPTNICTLKCPGCSRTQFIKRWPQHWNNHYLDVKQVLNFLDIDLKNKRINLCGNYGDPIYHPDLIDFVVQLKKTGAVVSMVTNGSYKDKHWWQSLVDCLDSNDTIYFSIDGLPENFTEYRINADWDSIKIGIEISTASKCQTIWKYIPFDYNQNNIEQVKAMSQDLGFDKFLVEPSDRFDEHTLNFLPKSDTLMGQRYHYMQDWKQQKIIPELNPRCHSKSEHFISASGFYTPCCYLSDHRFYYKTTFGKNKNKFNIANTTLSQILGESDVINFYQILDQQPGCQYNCPKIAD